MRARVAAAQLRLMLQVVLNVRLAAVLLIFLMTPQVIATPALVFGLAGLAISYLTMRRINRFEEHFRTGRWFPALDAAITLGLAFTADPLGPSLAYVAGSAFIWALLARPWAVAATVLPFFLTLGFALADQLFRQDLMSYWVTLVKVGLLWLAVLAGRRAHRLYLRQARLEEAASQASMRAAQAEERTRLSIEMHDSVAKSLHGIHLMAEHLEKALATQAPELAGHARTLRESVALARGEARTLVAEYRDEVEEDPFDSRLTALAEGWRSQHPDIELTTTIEPTRPGTGAEHEWLSAIGEALENVARHSGATKATLSCTDSDGWMVVDITDNGAGMADTSVDALVEDGHFGLDGMVRRMRRIRGEATISSSPGKGTTVTLTGPTNITVDQTLGGTHVS